MDEDFSEDDEARLMRLLNDDGSDHSDYNDDDNDGDHRSDIIKKSREGEEGEEGEEAAKNNQILLEIEEFACIDSNDGKEAQSPRTERARTTSSSVGLEWESDTATDLSDERKIVARVSEHTGLTLQCDEGEYVWTEDVPDISPDALDNLDEACFISNGEKTAELHLGSKKITIDSGDHAFSFSIRPDIRAETVLNLIQQVMLAFGSKCLATLPHNLNRELLFRPTHSASSSWQEARVYLGADVNKRRVLVVVVKPASNTSKSMISSGLGFAAAAAASWGGLGLGASGNDIGSTGSTFQIFIKDLKKGIADSLTDEKLTLGFLERIRLNSLSISSLNPLDSLLDPCFIRDLQERFFNDVLERLEKVRKSHIDTLSNLERQCARLMTLLRPYYEKFAVSLVSPPVRSNEFVELVSKGKFCPLVEENGKGSAEENKTITSSIFINQPSLDTAKLVILRARRSYLRETRDTNSGGSDQNDSLNYGLEIEGVLQRIYVQFRDLCESFGQEMLQKIKNLTLSRTEDIIKYRWNLVESLVSRRISSLEDLESWRYFKEKFRVASEEDPHIIDFKATMSTMLTDTGVSSKTGGSISNNNRSGVVFVTQRDIYFTSNHLPLIGEVQKIIPLRLVKSFSTTDATLMSNSSLVIVDSGGNTTTFWIPSTSPNYASRVGDLLKLLLEEKTSVVLPREEQVGEVTESKAIEQDVIIATSKDLIEMQSTKEETSPPLSVYPCAQLNKTSAKEMSVSSSDGNVFNDPFSDLTVAVMNTHATIEDKTTTESESNSAQSPLAAAIQSKSMPAGKMALGIQAFLDQQRKNSINK